MSQDELNMLNDTLERFYSHIEKRFERIEHALFEHWVAGKRMPGLIEQLSDLINELRKRDERREQLLLESRAFAWSIARPILVLLLLLLGVGTLHLFAGDKGTVDFMHLMHDLVMGS